MGNNESSFTRQIISGRNRYFIDVKETKNGDKYLSITENRFNGKERKRTVINIFGEAIVQIREGINEAVATIM